MSSGLGLGMNAGRIPASARRARLTRLLELLAPLRGVDPIVLGASLALTGIGLVAVYSAKLATLTAQGLPANYFLNRQLIAGALGLVLMIAATRSTRPSAPAIS